MPRPTLHVRRGSTLIEALISMSIVAVVVVGALETLGAVQRFDTRLVSGSVGHQLAQDLVGEIVQAAYRDPDGGGFGRETGEIPGDRTTFDDVDDFDGWSANPPVDPFGAALDAFTGWTRAVEVRNVDAATLADVASTLDTGVRRITVTVTGPTGAAVTFSALRCDIEGLRPPPTVDRAYVHHVGVELRLDALEASRIRTGVNVLNHRPPAAGGGP